VALNFTALRFLRSMVSLADGGTRSSYGFFPVVFEVERLAMARIIR
jgi:hypothetical protein